MKTMSRRNFGTAGPDSGTTGRSVMTRKAGLAGLMTLLLALLATAQAAELTDVRVESTGGEVRLILTTDSSFPEPTVFATEEPPRIVVDLPETSTSLSAESVSVGSGPAQSYQALSAGGRTRLVVDLSRMVPYELEMAGNELALVVSGGAANAVGADTSRARSGASGDAGHAITNFDFRRSPDGGGQVIVNLDQPGVNITVDERAGGLRVDLFDTILSEDMYRRLDVADFATPVQMITPEQRNDNVRLLIDVAGAYEHLAYQTDSQLVIEVERPEETEAEQDRELQFFEEREYEGSRITLNFQDIQVRSVLQLIADVSDLNIVVSDSVSGALTLRLTNVPWDQALDIVLETKNLDMRRSGNVIWIAPIEEIVSREQQILRARADRQTLEPLRTAMIPISYADASNLAGIVQSSAGEESGMLSERGSVSVDERTNTLLVTDTLENIDQIRDLVTELDRPVRQVSIESRIVIARHDFNYELGVRFGVTASRQDSRGNLFSTSATSEALDGINQTAIANRRSGRGSSTPVDIPGLEDRLNINLPVSNPAGSLGVSFLAADYLLDLELSALETEGRGEVISTPRLITANQQEAFIQQGVEIPFESLQGGNQAGAVNVEFKEAVLELRVRPLITPDNRVQLDLSIKQDTVGEIFETGRGGSVPSIDTREMGTNVLVDNGQTVVLGGIFQEERNFSSSKVPVMGDVPVLGHLFRRRGTEDQKRELLIFVTPSILDDRAAYDD
ncbi:type IV pilus secretin PilQ [Wenzhouxiangella limi]|uniref:Type IV pilus secretin PilQ n=1 Tax=Wenzhouxiangella limi TaxID=2707351 RepID=A0A845UZ53_9GAMM|nr:type IV pilus secretin PilQ [Wenzhouxiangella limi]NDY96008.1 type IV pilus secretin PilQ [Wenzhouxiangella limi]